MLWRRCSPRLVCPKVCCRSFPVASRPDRPDVQPRVDIFSFTGSSAVGKEIGKRAAEMLKPCTLELGGKSAAILLEDVDLAASVPMLVFSGLMNTGQACVAQTRILAPRSRYDEIVEAVGNFAASLPVGPPSDAGAQIGSLISAN